MSPGLTQPRSLEPVLYGAVFAVGVALDFACRFFPADLPFFLPWEFSWPEYLGVVLTLVWFGFGWRRVTSAERPPRWRVSLFLVGMASFYVVLQTHIDFWAQHMFFVHRWAHFVLHHIGAFLIALGMAGPVIRAGMPQPLQRLIGTRLVRQVVTGLQHPAIAPVLFVGLLYFWLIPQIHTRVMLDANLYDVMNWTMAINGVMFWSLVLDARAKPPARLSHLMRAAMILIIELPQMVLGALLSLSEHDVYPVYDICGRIWPMTALNDQHFGGLIIWLPGTLTSFAAMIVVLWTMRVNEEAEERIGSPA